MKNRIAYNVVTGEVIEARTNKKTFHKIVTRAKRADRQCYGLNGMWVFRNPWS